MNRLAKQAKELDRLTWHLRSPAMEMSLKQLDDQRHLTAVIRAHSLYSDRYLQLLGDVRQTVRTFSEMHSIASQVAKSLPNFDSWALKQHHQLESLQNLIPESTAAMIQSIPTQILGDSVASFMAAVETFSPPQEILIEGQRLSQAYFSFASNQLKRIRGIEEIGRSIRCAVLDVTSAMFEESTDRFHLSLEGIRPGYPFEPELPDIRHNLFPLINQHISPIYSRSELEADQIQTDELVRNSLPGRIHGIGGVLIELIFGINGHQRSSGSQLVFKRTDRVITGASRIPNTVVTDEESFAVIVDYLYFMLYEGSGDASRLLDIAEDAECQPLWKLKHLRRYFRHDIEHGSETTIRKKKRETREAFAILIDKPWPRSTHDWKQAQVALYEDLVDMLSKILKGLTERA